MIGPSTTLRELAFIVCSAMDADGTKAILSGGGAATVYAPEACQSHDLDFIFEYWSTVTQPSAQPLFDIGFVQQGQSYVHPRTPLTVEFPSGPLAIGDELITQWETIREGDLVLYILSSTDCVRDRLAWFMFNNDFSSLEQALAVARHNPVDFDFIEHWCKREGELGKYQTFAGRLAQTRDDY